MLSILTLTRSGPTGFRFGDGTPGFFDMTGKMEVGEDTYTPEN